MGRAKAPIMIDNGPAFARNFGRQAGGQAVDKGQKANALPRWRIGAANDLA